MWRNGPRSVNRYNGKMHALCHRCHGELPSSPAGGRHDDDAAMLFCPRCGSPQLLLPEHMYVEAPVSAASTTGAVPPPRPAGSGAGEVDWQAAIRAASLVSLVAAVLLIVGLIFSPVSFFSTLWTMGAAVIALGLYARSRPQASMDARVGLRIGLATGTLVIAAMVMVLAGTGVVMRFGTHSLTGFDAEMAQTFELIRVRAAASLQEQGQPADIQQKILAFVGSPEARAGIAVFYLSLTGFFILLLSAGGGAFAGMMRGAQAQRLGQRSGD